MMFSLYVVRNLCLALVAGAVAGRRLSAGARRAVMAGAILLACGFWTLMRTDGIRVGKAQLAWRWTPSAEERLLARAPDEPVAPPAVRPVVTAPEKPLVAPAADAPARVTTNP